MVVRVGHDRLAAFASTATRLTYRDDSAETPLFRRRDFGNIAMFLVFGKRNSAKNSKSCCAKRGQKTQQFDRTTCESLNELAPKRNGASYKQSNLFAHHVAHSLVGHDFFNYGTYDLVETPAV